MRFRLFAHPRFTVHTLSCRSEALSEQNDCESQQRTYTDHGVYLRILPALHTSMLRLDLNPASVVLEILA